MEGTRLLAELHRHQNAVLPHLDGIRPLFARPPAEAQVELSRRRWELVRLLRGYQLFKHGELFDPLIRRGGPTEHAVATRMKAACIALGEGFAVYVRRWSTADVAALWPEYRADTLAMYDRLRSHLAHERQESARLLAVRPRRAA